MAERRNPFLRAALYYASRSWHVFPCRMRGKAPLTPHGLQDATTDVKIIREWWEKWPGANVGIATGQSGLVVVDVDAKNGAQGMEAWRELRAELHLPDETPTVETPTGGMHIYYAAQAGVEIRNSAGKLGAGLDIRAEGGYVIAPPSIHPDTGTDYAWAMSYAPTQRALLPLPKFLGRRLVEMGRTVSPPSSPPIDGSGLIPQGQRNDALTSLAGTMRRRGMTPDAIEAALVVENVARCSPPLPEDEVRRIAQGMARYDPEDDEETPGQIVVSDRRLRDITAAALDALVSANDPPQVFVRSGRLTRVVADEHGVPKIEPFSEAALRGRLERVTNFVSISKDEKGRKHVHPVALPWDMVRDLAALGAWELPPLVGITEAPTIRADGVLVVTPGYDPGSGLIYEPDPSLSVPPISGEPSVAERETAVALLHEILCDFPYDCEASRANAVAALMTPVLRPMIAGPTPLVLLDKPQAGSGGSLQAEVIALIATGRASAMLTAPKDEESWRKAITSLLLAGRTVVTIDNVDGQLSAPSLAAALTSITWQDRLLGGNGMITLPQRATWLATGNNLSVGGDLGRRCVWVRIDSQRARPWERSGFRHPNLIEWVKEQRGAILAAILTLARGWVAAGRPTPVSLPHVGGFEDWTRTIGGILAFAGISGFLGNLNQFYDAADEEGSQWQGFLTIWQEHLGDKVMTGAALAETLQVDTALREALPSALAEAWAAGKSFTVRLGKALSRRAGMRFPSGVHLAKGGKLHGAVAWLVRCAKDTKCAGVAQPGASADAPGEIGEVGEVVSPRAQFAGIIEEAAKQDGPTQPPQPPHPHKEPRPRASIAQEVRTRLGYAGYSDEQIDDMTTQQLEQALHGWLPTGTRAPSRPLASMEHPRLTLEMRREDEYGDLF